MRRLSILLALCAALLALAACGDDDGGGGQSKDEVVEEANGICKDAMDEVDQLQANLASSDLAAVGDFFGKAADVIDGAVDDLKDLDPPGEDKEAFDDFINVSEEQVETARDAQEAAEAGDQARVEELGNRLDELDEESNRAAEEYGIDDCVSDDDAQGGGGPTQTKEEVVEAGNEICDQAERDIQAVERPQSAADLKDYAAQVKPIVTRAIEQLRGLNPPAEDRPQLDAYLGVLDQQVDKLDELIQAGSSGDTEEAQRILREFQGLNDDGNEAAREFGLDSCAD